MRTRKSFSYIAAIALALILAVSCDVNNPGLTIPDPEPGPVGPIPSSDNSVSISVVGDEVVIAIDGVGKEADGSAKVIAVDMSAYYTADEFKGLSKEVDDGSDVVGEYLCGTVGEIVFPRFSEEGRDYYYKKYYIINDEGILKGPLWVTGIEARNKAEDTYGKWDVTPSKKGIMYENGSLDYILDLDVKYVKIDMRLNEMVAWNEGYTTFDGPGAQWEGVGDLVYAKDFGGATDYANNPKYEAWDFDGTTYYFNTDTFKRNYDPIIKELSDNNVKVTVVLLLESTTNQNSVPYFLAFPHVRSTDNISGQNQFAVDGGHGLIMPNTSNKYGAGYFGALISYIANRYSTGEHGYVQDYILMNEIDYPRVWNSVVSEKEMLPSFDEYIEEYYRCLRIAGLALAEIDADYCAMVSTTHRWTHTEMADTYCVKEIYDTLISKTNLQGNFKWGMASHAYATSLNSKDVVLSESMAKAYSTADPERTRYITLGNIEVYDAYFGNANRRMPDGSMRPVYMTEVGVKGTGEVQAAGIAYAYYKAEMVESIKAFEYFSLSDLIHGEANSFGLLDQKMNEKLSYGLWKDIDSAPFDKYASYIESLQYFDRKTNRTNLFAEGASYLDVVKAVSKSVGTSKDWNKAWADMSARLGIEE